MNNKMKTYVNLIHCASCIILGITAVAGVVIGVAINDVVKNVNKDK